MVATVAPPWPVVGAARKGAFSAALDPIRRPSLLDRKGQRKRGFHAPFGPISVTKKVSGDRLRGDSRQQRRGRGCETWWQRRAVSGRGPRCGAWG
ncbi:hypothetical protein ERO13_D10G119166v2 [Gossypium hirsutum]|nr:hypothetical protein ERO13_D10G119166v2 [Gossypium hirsutum]